MLRASKLKAPDGPRVKEAYRLRPMNCPHHHKVFDAEPRSYRDLPLRLAEYGQVYRFEDSGAVSGLVRVRGMCMNDAHIYCTAEQIKDEFKAIMGMYQEAYDILGLDTFHVRLSKWDPQDPKGKEKYVDNPEAWQESEQILEEVLVELGIDFKVGIGEGAFYGPKIDIQFNTVTGREESVSTVQLDFAVPGRMNLKYVGSDGEEHTPYCIHRAPFSTHERMVAFLIEHYGGAFPTWLAPIQVQMLTVSEQYDDYANDIVRRLRGQMVRAELAPSNDTLPKKIRQGATRKIPNLLIIGEREVADGTVTLRRYGQRDQHTMSVEAFESALMHAIKRRLPEVAVADEG
jgi:threonyl-tRNA synthetase